MGEAYADRQRRLYRGLTHEEVRLGCLNFGIDLGCGSCAAVFYAGCSAFPHDEGCRTVEPFSNGQRT
jgi:hypothetical protein